MRDLDPLNADVAGMLVDLGFVLRREGSGFPYAADQSGHTRIGLDRCAYRCDDSGPSGQWPTFEASVRAYHSARVGP